MCQIRIIRNKMQPSFRHGCAVAPAVKRFFLEGASMGMTELAVSLIAVVLLTWAVMEGSK